MTTEPKEGLEKMIESIVLDCHCRYCNSMEDERLDCQKDVKFGIDELVSLIESEKKAGREEALDEAVRRISLYHSAQPSKNRMCRLLRDLKNGKS